MEEIGTSVKTEEWQPLTCLTPSLGLQVLSLQSLPPCSNPKNLRSDFLQARTLAPPNLTWLNLSLLKR